MAQLTLFETTDTVLADDARGRITYTARVVDVDLVEPRGRRGARAGLGVRLLGAVRRAVPSAWSSC